jgi:hypothetical protein
MSNQKKRKGSIGTSPNLGPLSPNIGPINLIDVETQTNNKDNKDEETTFSIQEIYTEKDVDFLKKIKKNSAILYHKFMESRNIILSRTIQLKDIISLDISNEKRSILLEQYECFSQIMPYTQDYIDARNNLRNLYNRFAHLKQVSDDPDVELLKSRFNEMALSPLNKTIIEEKIEEFQYSEKGDEKSKLKRWLMLVTSLPFDKLSRHEYDIVDKLEEIKTFFDKTLFGMKNVKERLLLFLNKKLRNVSKGCNIALIGKPGVGKCLHPNTPVRMADLSIKFAKDIYVGDYLMGDDSTPREVTSITTGKEEMYKVIQEFGDSYIVNKSHILTLYRKIDKRIVDIPIVDVVENEYLYTPISGYYDGNIDVGEEASSYGILYAGYNEPVLKIPAHFPLLPPTYLEWTLENKMSFYYSLIKHKLIDSVYISDIYSIDSIIDLLQSSGIRCRRLNRYIVFIHGTETFRIIPQKIGDYCGFTITHNNRFLLGDWTVTHNTAIAKAMSKCLNIPFSQVNFGGINNSEFLLGHDYTYIGSRPGEITRCLSRMGTKNGILFFDEFDKASERKEIMSTLLHITDFSQNNEFRDNYFPELYQDLSNIWFIYSMNELPKDPAMLDRLEIIKVDEYDYEDKKIILKDYILPKFSKELGIQDDFIIEEKAFQKLIGLQKSGVRQLERSVTLLMEKIYFFICNSRNDYEYDWFITLKKSIKNQKLVITEELIKNVIFNNDESFLNMYS